MGAHKIPRLYGEKSPKRLIRKYTRPFVKAEEIPYEQLTDAEEFTLYLLRMHTNGYSKTQAYYALMMGVSEHRISEYIGSLEKKGYLHRHKKEIGRSKWYQILKNPDDKWCKVPHATLKYNSINWKHRLFNIRLYRIVLDDVNEIHYKDREIYTKIGVSKGTFIKNRNRLEKVGLIEKLSKTAANPNGGYRVDVHGLLCMQEPGECAELWKE